MQEYLKAPLYAKQDDFMEGGYDLLFNLRLQTLTLINAHYHGY